MPKQCIFCDDPAGSREHVFPAALGGRRTSKQIYCERHNNGFGPLANIIANQLKPINALLSVRHDRADAPKPFTYEAEDGSKLQLFNGSVQRADSGSSKDDTLRIQLGLGGPDGLQAIGYIALTFFAHYFQDWARLSELNPIKEFLLEGSRNEYVWWESAETSASLPRNPFRFGHTIQLITDKETQKAWSVVSLFQALTFGVEFGQLSKIDSRKVTIFIDPHAEHPPHDMVVSTTGTVDRRLKKPEPLQAHLRDTIYGGVGQGALAKLFADIERWKFDGDMDPIIDRLKTSMTDPLKLRDEVEAVVGHEAGRVFRLAKYVVDDLKKREGSNPNSKQLIAIISAQIAEDASRDNGLSPLAEAALSLAAGQLAAALIDELKTEPLTHDLLWKYFSSGHGAWIVGQALLNPFLEALQIATREEESLEKLLRTL